MFLSREVHSYMEQAVVTNSPYPAVRRSKEQKMRDYLAAIGAREKGEVAPTPRKPKPYQPVFARSSKYRRAVLRDSLTVGPTWARHVLTGPDLVWFNAHFSAAHVPRIAVFPGGRCDGNRA